ncbi:ATP-binding protein [bacterium]|nr:ATP-binding protein [bacterium]
MFQRNILHELDKWSKKRDRKPLIIKGARQVGKTTAINIFSENFDEYLYFNLDLKEDRELFEQDLSISDLITALFLYRNKSKPDRGKTLVFIDEIQNVPEALSQLRYFYETASDLYVIASGSLLETISSRKKTYPVGRVEILNMFPLTFSEYLKAMGLNKVLEFYDLVPPPKLAHSILLKHFHRYTLLGGMPEVIEKYRKTEDILIANSIYSNLLETYKEDVKKYARNNNMAEIIRYALDTAPLEAGTRIKFHGFGNSDCGSRNMGEALRTLEKAMLVDIVYPTTEVKPPMKPDSKKSPKLFFLDTGLVNYSVGLQDHFFKMDDLHSFYQGILAEHIVEQELKATYCKNRKLNFWVRAKKQSTAEVDFVVPYKNLVIPVEVKSGKSGTLKSLHQFVNRANHPYAIRLYAGYFSIEKHITPSGTEYCLLNLPYYLAGKLKTFMESFIK